ncbi:MAG: hypothetical protein LWX83_19050 [Anaerolineae bacterium]|nr:hypothetical protein [Anaerolineae bacterium]
MSNQKPDKITVNSGIFTEILVRTKLVLKLMGDSRVNPFLKIIPIASVIYVFNPLDIPGPLDDLALFSLGIYAFVELCPSQVVQEHLDRLHGIDPHMGQKENPPDNVIDGEFKVIDDDKS